MADNVTITPGSGDTVAADDVSGVKYQRIKLDSGGDGATVPVTTSAGLPTDLRQIAGTAVDANSGNKSGGTQRVVLATDQPQLTNPLKTVYGSRTRSGVYLGNSGVQTVLATAHGATAGFFWIINPAGNSKTVALRRLTLVTQIVAATAFATAPRISVERMTFTGTHSGSTVTCGKHETADATQTALFTLDTTGLTPSAAAALWCFFPIVTVGITNTSSQPAQQDWTPGADEFTVVLAPGEGIVCRQADNGSTSDTRRFMVNVEWEEYT